MYWNEWVAVNFLVAVYEHLGYQTAVEQRTVVSFHVTLQYYPIMFVIPFM